MGNAIELRKGKLCANAQVILKVDLVHVEPVSRLTETLQISINSYRVWPSQYMFEEYDHLKLVNNTMHVLHYGVFRSSQESLLRTRNEELEHLYAVTIGILPA